MVSRYMVGLLYSDIGKDFARYRGCVYAHEAPLSESGRGYLSPLLKCSANQRQVNSFMEGVNLQIVVFSELG